MLILELLSLIFSLICSVIYIPMFDSFIIRCKPSVPIYPENQDFAAAAVQWEESIDSNRAFNRFVYRVHMEKMKSSSSIQILNYFTSLISVPSSIRFFNFICWCFN